MSIKLIDFFYDANTPVAPLNQMAQVHLADQKLPVKCISLVFCIQDIRIHFPHNWNHSYIIATISPLAFFTSLTRSTLQKRSQNSIWKPLRPLRFMKINCNKKFNTAFFSAHIYVCVSIHVQIQYIYWTMFFVFLS